MRQTYLSFSGRLTATLTACVAALALLSPPASAAAGQVLAGVDVLRADGCEVLQGKKVGLITNHTGLARDGATTLQVLLDGGVEIVALFSPEHGFYGVKDEKVGDARHEQTGLPIFSLYGDTRKPTPESLKGVDTLVFDIQDIGCRFYTYISTMGLAMEAAAENDIVFMVLDRPNPIGGHIVEGPVLDVGKESFVGWHTIPVRHGMTVGEMARMLNVERDIGCELQIVPVEGWDRTMYFDSTGLYWTNPSPNMRSLTEALLYPAVGLGEFTNISVGRGTDTPFEVLGAPWINGRALALRLNAANVPGVRFVPIRFTPDASRFAGEQCEGVNIVITDRARYRSMPLAFALNTALRDLYPEDWKPERYQRLLNDDAVYKALMDGASARSLLVMHHDELKAFERRRAAFLMYTE